MVNRKGSGSGNCCARCKSCDMACTASMQEGVDPTHNRVELGRGI